MLNVLAAVAAPPAAAPILTVLVDRLRWAIKTDPADTRPPSEMVSAGTSINALANPDYEFVGDILGRCVTVAVRA